MVVEENGSLSCVSIKPFTLRLDKEIRIILSCVVGFSNSRWSPNPHAPCGFGCHCLLSVDLEKINRLFYLPVFTDVYDACLYRGGNSHLYYVGVTSGDVAFLVSSCWSHPEGPRSFESRFLFVTIFIGAIIFFNKLKMAFFAMGFEKPNAFFVLRLHEELYVWCSVFPFLELPCRKHDAVEFAPGLDVLGRVDRGVVQCSNDHSRLCHVCRRLL